MFFFAINESALHILINYFYNNNFVLYLFRKLMYMGRFNKIHWALFCIIVFLVSRIVMLYQYNLAKDILSHSHLNFFSAMCKWDCKWYITIIKDGYDSAIRTTGPKIWRGLANWAFFPLYPYTVKSVAYITSLPPVMVGILLNQLFIFLALLIFYKYLSLFVDDDNSRFGVVLLAFSPFSIYFATLYTEALFLLLSLSGFYFMRINKPVVSAICGGLLSATRPVGIMYSLAYFLYYGLRKKLNLKILICCAVTTLGLLLYMLYLQLHAGEALFNLLCILPGVLTGTMMSEGRFCGTLFTLYFGLTLLARKSTSLKISLVFLFFLFYISYFLYWLVHAIFLI
ncbi:MAG: hypothetical protein K0R94_209 [Burkholderiales bacterium]|nr:hypothetical protein [Burkholderiales bacterium]